MSSDDAATAASNPAPQRPSRPPRAWRRWVASGLLLILGCVGALAACYFATPPYADCPHCGLELRWGYFTASQRDLLWVRFGATLPAEFQRLAERHPEAVVRPEPIEDEPLLDEDTASKVEPSPSRWYRARIVKLDEPYLAVNLNKVANPSAYDQALVRLLSRTQMLSTEAAARSDARIERLRKQVGPDSLRCPLCRNGELRLKPDFWRFW